MSASPANALKTVRSFLIAADISFSMAQTDWVVNGKAHDPLEAREITHERIYRTKKK